VVEYFNWVTRIAEGAAMMTQTRVEWSIDTDCHEQIPNRVLADAIDRNLHLVGPPRFTDEDRAFAARIRESLPDAPEGPALIEDVEPVSAEPKLIMGSTDICDVSWHTPVGHLRAATYANGCPGHSWQIVACSGTDLGENGGVVAAKALACTTLDLLTDSQLREQAWEDFRQRRGTDPYSLLIPLDQRPPLPSNP
jgi:aminobenzoyl-glutamate utilization protein B